MNNTNKIKILFVCMGNICRSPTAQGVFRSLVRRAGLDQTIEIDSAGTHAYYHSGSPPDPRSQMAASERGVDISDLRARIVRNEDFAYYDYILAMDRENLQHLSNICPQSFKGKLSLFLDYATQVNRWDVPDPYYDGPDGFKTVFELIENAAQGLLVQLRSRFKLDET